jgi:hypothetical protein
VKPLANLTAAAWAVALFVMLGGACGPAQHPCVLDYEKAGDCPECTAEQIEARIAKVDEVCAHQLLGHGGAP